MHTYIHTSIHTCRVHQVERLLANVWVLCGQMVCMCVCMYLLYMRVWLPCGQMVLCMHACTYVFVIHVCVGTLDKWCACVYVCICYTCVCGYSGQMVCMHACMYVFVICYKCVCGCPVVKWYACMHGMYVCICMHCSWVKLYVCMCACFCVCMSMYV